MADKKKHNLFVYGTLRPGTNRTTWISGEMYDCGWYPGVLLGGKGCNSSFLVEVIEVDDARLERIDNYEGYHPEKPLTSLYLRKPVSAIIHGEEVTGWIYVYNQDVDGFEFIPDGDWLKHTKEMKGRQASLGGVPDKPAELVFDGERAAK